MSSCSAELPSGSLPTSMRMASRRAYSRMAGLTRRSTTSTSADCRCCCALSVMRSGSPGTAADQRHAADRLLPARPGRELAVELAVGGIVVSSQNGLAPTPCSRASHVRRRTTGSATASCTRRRSGWRAPRDLSEMRRQPALDPGLDLAGENGRGAFGADGDDDRIAVDDGRHDEIALRGTVDDVHRQAAGRAGGGDPQHRARRRRWRRTPAPRLRGRPSVKGRRSIMSVGTAAAAMSSLTLVGNDP